MNRAPAQIVVQSLASVGAVRYAQGLGTLYTLVMRPSDGSIEYRWPGSSWRMSLSEPARDTPTIVLEDSAHVRPLL